MYLIVLIQPNFLKKAKKAIRIIYGAKYFHHTATLFYDKQLLIIFQIIELKQHFLCSTLFTEHYLMTYNCTSHYILQTQGMKINLNKDMLTKTSLYFFKWCQCIEYGIDYKCPINVI